MRFYQYILIYLNFLWSIYQEVQLVYNINNVMFISGDDGGTVKLWDIRKPEPVFSIKVGEEHVSDMITNDAQKYLVCASGDGVLTSIDLKGR